MTFLMKGHVYGERKHTITYPVYAEVKYDEIRVHVHREGDAVQFLAYSGKPLYNLDQWADQFSRLMRLHGIEDLDCGVEVNGNFGDSYRWTRSSKGIPEEKFDKATGKTLPKLYSHMVQFILFDLPNSTKGFRERRADRQAIANAARSLFGMPLKIPQSTEACDEDDLESFFEAIRELGHEGLMVKQMDHLYMQGKRTDGWLKMKPEETADGRITRINQAVAENGTPHDRAGSVDVVLEDGSTASPSGFEWGIASAMWQNPEKYIGRWVEFKFMERDRKGGYRHPSFVRFREPKL